MLTEFCQMCALYHNILLYNDWKQLSMRNCEFLYAECA